MIEAIVALAIIIIILQMGLSVYQLRYYDKFIRQLVQKYNNTKGFELKTERSKNLLRTVIVVVVLDEGNIIVEAYEFKGNTIFSKFKPIEDILNIRIDIKFIKRLENEKNSLRNQALLKLLNKKMRPVAD